MRSRIVEIYRAFNLPLVIVESNGYQEALRRDMAATTDIPIRGYQTGGEKYSEEIGINSLAVEFENDKWILPYDTSDAYTVRMVDRLVEGLLRFPSGHTADILMACWFANTGIRDLTAKQETGTVSFGTHQLWKTGGRVF